MTEEQVSAPEPEAKKSKWPMLTIFGWGSTMVATVAAAISAWASLQSIEEAKSTQLLSRRVDACFEVHRRATSLIAPALARLRELADDEARAALRGDLHWYGSTDVYGGYYGGTIDGFEIVCAEGEEQSACAARRQRATQHYDDMVELAERASTVRREMEFDAASTFSLIGPVELAAAERDLVDNLQALGAPQYADDVQRLNAAIAAHSQFREACQRAISEYSD